MVQSACFLILMAEESSVLSDDVLYGPPTIWEYCTRTPLRPPLPLNEHYKKNPFSGPLYDCRKEEILIVSHIIYHNNGRIKEKYENYRSGRLGRHTTYYDNGELRTETRFKNGCIVYDLVRYSHKEVHITNYILDNDNFLRPNFKLDGAYTSTASNDIIKIISQYRQFKDGKHIFQCKLYDYHGNMMYEQTFEDNFLQYWLYSCSFGS